MQFIYLPESKKTIFTNQIYLIEWNNENLCCKVNFNNGKHLVASNEDWKLLYNFFFNTMKMSN